MDADEYRSPLPGPAVAALESLWSRLADAPGSPTLARADLRMTARIVAVAARTGDLTPESLLVAVKSSWALHPGIRRIELGHMPHETLADLVTLCIQEYFAASNLDRRGDSADPPSETPSSTT